MTRLPRKWLRAFGRAAVAVAAFVSFLLALALFFGELPPLKWFDIAVLAVAYLFSVLILRWAYDEHDETEAERAIRRSREAVRWAGRRAK